MQRLKLPIDSFKPTAGYKSAKYKQEWGYKHYGVDCMAANGDAALYGLGEGTVVAAGLDGLNGKTTGVGSGCGYCLIVVYKDCENNKTGKGVDLVVTYMHLKAMPKVGKGAKVTAKTLLGYYGNTGANTTGPHLHIQMDKDTKYPLYCCGLNPKGHNLLKAGTVDSTVDPTDYMFLGEGQSMHAGTSSWYTKSDFTSIPNIGKGASFGIDLLDKYPTKAVAQQAATKLKAMGFDPKIKEI